MEALIILVATFLLALILAGITKKKPLIYLDGRIAMTAMLLFTAISHFVYTRGMALMLPPFVPFRKELVILPASWKRSERSVC